MFGHNEPIGFSPIDQFDGNGVTVIELPGHSPGMLGFGTEDGVWFTGDAYLGLGYLENNIFGFVYRLDEFIESLHRIRGLRGNMFVPGHGRTERDIAETVDRNLECIDRQLDMIKDVCSTWTGIDQLAGRMGEIYRLPEDTGYNAMVYFNLRNYLSYLQDIDELQCRLEDRVMKWCIK